MPSQCFILALASQI